MADFCLQCNLALYFGPHSDFAWLAKDGPLPPGVGYGVLCEGCGFIRVDHLGRCMGDPGCIEKHIPPGDDEVLRSIEVWLARRSGPLGAAYRLRDRLLGTPWEPGLWHDWKHRFYRWRDGDEGFF